MKIYSIVVCSAGLAVLAISILLVTAKCLNVSLETYNKFRMALAVVITGHAMVSFFRMATKVAIHGQLEPSFVPELIGYLVFWVLFPPLWFFLEYLGADHGVIAGLNVDLKRMKDYQDLAAKIWAAVVAILVALVGLRHK